MEVFMLRKVLVLAGSAILVVASITAVPANAATKISNGVPCSKNNATTKVGSVTYKCAKNALKKNAKLTWLSSSCVKTSKGYTKSVSDLAKEKVDTDAQIVSFQEGLDKLKVTLEQVPILAAKVEDYTQRVNALKADTENLAKNAATITAWNTALIRTKTALLSYRPISQQVITVEKAIAEFQNQYKGAASDSKKLRKSAKAACKNGR